MAMTAITTPTIARLDDQKLVCIGRRSARLGLASRSAPARVACLCGCAARRRLCRLSPRCEACAALSPARPPSVIQPPSTTTTTTATTTTRVASPPQSQGPSIKRTRLRRRRRWWGSSSCAHDRRGRAARLDHKPETTSAQAWRPAPLFWRSKLAGFALVNLAPAELCFGRPRFV
jgi:hypothetical protein